MSSSPPDGFEARPLGLGDASEAADLLHAYDAGHLEEVTDRLSEQDVVGWWRWYELGHESIAAWDGRLAGFGLLNERERGVFRVHAFVHPERMGRGLGSFLIAWAEERVHPGGRLRLDIMPSDRGARDLVEGRGYQWVRSGCRMVIDLEEAPPEAVWPDGFSPSRLHRGEERLVYEVLEDAFAEEWGRRRLSFEEWQRNILEAEWFDPALCFLVRTGEETVAAETCAHRFGMGWVGSIGVLAPWRRRGLGRALLLHAFGELYRRGERRVGLGVDSQNPTGATRLYEAVGMRFAWQADTYERAL